MTKNTFKFNFSNWFDSLHLRKNKYRITRLTGFLGVISNEIRNSKFSMVNVSLVE